MQPLVQNTHALLADRLTDRKDGELDRKEKSAHPLPDTATLPNHVVVVVLAFKYFRAFSSVLAFFLSTKQTRP